MGSIRPLITITVLLIVGAFLFAKINEGPTRSQAGAPGTANQLSEGVPPLTAAPGGASLAQDSAAPAWPPAASTAPPTTLKSPATTPAPAATGAPALNAAPGSAPATDTNKEGMPEVPPIPELPELPSTSSVSPPTTQSLTAQPSTPPTTELPTSAPDSRYGDATGPKLGLGAAAEAPLASPPAATAPDAPASTLPAVMATPPIATGASASNATPANTLPIGSTDATPASSPALQSLAPANTAPVPATAPAATPAAPANTLRSPAPSAAATPPTADRYGNVESSLSQPTPAPFGATSTALPAQLSTPSPTAGTTFAASWPAIQAALDRGDLKQAHQLLSKWHGDESLTPAESQKVEALLGQLAGTVIYSTEHQLEPARVVKPGETLDSIAKEYNVPAALLAKINSIASPDQLRPGQPLKVVRGPFSAIVDLHRNELTLEVDGRYAGTFAVAVPPGVTVTEGQWTVDQKLGGGHNPVTAATLVAAADRTIVLRNAAIGAAPGGPTLAIASGSATPGPGTAAIRVAPQDAEDLSDILSIGSRVIVRR